MLVLIHGITSDSRTWRRVMPYLARRFTVIAPDLIGHGGSAKPKGDYSLGAHASGVRDLLVALGHERASFVGHSLGGGIAMQLSYQFPERCERLVLVDSGGLGRDVSLLLRAATLPGSELVLPLLAATRMLEGGRLGRRTARARRPARGHRHRGDRARPRDARRRRGARRVRAHAARGRRARRPARRRLHRLYLAERLPLLLVWGERDSMIPVAHAPHAHARLAASRLEMFADSGHFPQLDEPQRFLDVLGRLHRLDRARGARRPTDWRELLAPLSRLRRAARRARSCRSRGARRALQRIGGGSSGKCSPTIGRTKPSSIMPVGLGADLEVQLRACPSRTRPSRRRRPRCSSAAGG